MASYNGRRAPNVSQYLANLNTIPSPQDAAAQNAFGTGDDLDFLTNTEFFDFDTFDTNLDDFAASVPPSQGTEKPVPKPGNGVGAAGMKLHEPIQPIQPINTAPGPGYQFSEFQTYPTISTSPLSTLPSPATNLQGTYPPQPTHFSAGDKRTASQAGLPSHIHAMTASPLSPDMEDVSRYAAEEDKRRRNTAASARFRVKKKQKEQALEKHTREMQEKVSKLEGRVKELEMENKWLKELVVKKGGTEGMEKVEEVDGAGEAQDERSREGRDDGVGTEEVAA
ncbi:hypothetical protein LTR62_007353 [Meristemomyces frigidus]|uniref:BZIP domain-containing protein n=1 Tax=Meristemomyces frigidus TaxID=1508187 RepID=A0AAN7TNE3_9PEZI|nr:hypothetical protein LTR62_007353 [Meristemomyces frigidus]